MRIKLLCYTLTFAKVYTVSKDGALFVWLCCKEMSDIKMKDQNEGEVENGSGLQYYFAVYLNISCCIFHVRVSSHYKHYCIIY